MVVEYKTGACRKRELESHLFVFDECNEQMTKLILFILAKVSSLTDEGFKTHSLVLMINLRFKP